MNTFVPYEDFKKCAECLDDKRLYKQVVECKQILKALKAKRLGTKYGWQNHPAVLMWEGYEPTLRHYQLIMLDEWLERRWNVHISDYGLLYDNKNTPVWLGDDNLHTSHRAKLYRKDPEHYKQFALESDEWNSNEYYWPTKEGLM